MHSGLEQTQQQPSLDSILQGLHHGDKWCFDNIEVDNIFSCIYNCDLRFIFLAPHTQFISFYLLHIDETMVGPICL